MAGTLEIAVDGLLLAGIGYAVVTPAYTLVLSDHYARYHKRRRETAVPYVWFAFLVLIAPLVLAFGAWWYLRLLGEARSFYVAFFATLFAGVVPLHWLFFARLTTGHYGVACVVALFAFLGTIALSILAGIDGEPLALAFLIAANLYTLALAYHSWAMKVGNVARIAHHFPLTHQHSRR